jgi:hypothetical protein
VALAAVYNRERNDLAAGRDSTDASARFAGVGRLVVVTDQKNPEVSVNAWADIKWVLSGRALCHELELLYRNATPSVQQSGARTNTTLLLGDDLANRIDSELADPTEILSATAAVHGFKLQILRRPRRHTGDVLEHVRRTPPSLLVIAAPQDSKVDTIVDAYRQTNVTQHVYQLGNCTPDQLLELFRETIGVASGINPGLFVSARPQIGSSGDVDHNETVAEFLVIQNIWPVSHPGREKIHGVFGKFVENLDDGFWYTRDKARHATSQVKRYRRNGRLLEHDADIGADGNTIDKHKGDVGSVVSLDDMRGV